MSRFNLGKLYHVYKTTKRVDSNDLVYTGEYLNDETRSLMNDPNTTAELKVDGEATMIVKQVHKYGGYQLTEDTWYNPWQFYRRQDNYRGPCMSIPLPAGKQPDTYNQGKPHHYRLLWVDPESGTSKQNKMAQETYAIIRKAAELGILPKLSDKGSTPFISCEWVGKKHQLNLDGIPYDHALVPHLPEFTGITNFPRTFDGLQRFFEEHVVEGLVLQHPSGTRYKIRADMFPTSGWVREGDKRRKRIRELKKLKLPKKPIVESVTTIKPKVLTKDGLLVWNYTDNTWQIDESPSVRIV